uniref:Conopeptide Mi043 n=1 Tax=Conus miles TaxID=69564 RepID=A0A0E3X223_CONMI|nr:conopeptide Mi043 [Conus miles]
MMCRLTSLCCLLVIVLLNSAVDGVPCQQGGGKCSSDLKCCDGRDVCCGTSGSATCTIESECSGERITHTHRALHARFFRR